MIVKTEADVACLLQFIAEQDIIAYDTETTGLNTRRDKIIGFGISNVDTSFYLPLASYSVLTRTLSSCEGADFALEILQALQSKKLIMFNASFDARITKSNFGIDLLPTLHTDVLLLKHTIDEEMPFGLKEIATKVFGYVTKEKEEMLASIKANGGTAKEYYKADTNILAKYCEQDCLLTFKLYNHYSRQLREQGLEKFYYEDEVLPLYKEVTVPMEEAGVTLDMPLLNQTLVNITQDLVNIEWGIQEAIAPHLELFRNWFLNKDYPLQTYTGKAPAWTKKYPLQLDAWSADNPGKYMFNLQSKHHLKKLFFDTLKCVPLSKTPTGLPQVDEEFMESIISDYPWVAKLIEYNKLNKIKSTYLERFLNEQEDGRFYPSWLQHRTVSGRYAGDFQQLPASNRGDSCVDRYTNIIRSLIIAEPNCDLISADYEQLEPRVFAHVSRDVALKNIFLSNADFYTEIAKMVEGLETVTKEQRQDAKTYALGIPYGLTGYKLKFELNISEEQADALIEKYLSAFPELRKMMDESKEEAISTGVIRASTGRLRRLQKAKAIYSKYGPVIRDSLQLWKTYHDTPAIYAQVKQDYRTFKNECNNSINFRIQGLAAGVMNRASIAINRKLKIERLNAKLIAQIHDQVLYQCPKSETKRTANIVKDCMENTYKLTIPLITNPVIAGNFKDCK